MAKRCTVCTGSGKIMGGGMMLQDCDECDGLGKITDLKLAEKEAITKIKACDPNLTEKDAQKVLDEELTKLDNENNILKLKDKRNKKDV